MFVSHLSKEVCVFLTPHPTVFVDGVMMTGYGPHTYVAMALACFSCEDHKGHISDCGAHTIGRAVCAFIPSFHLAHMLSRASWHSLIKALSACAAI